MHAKGVAGYPKYSLSAGRDISYLFVGVLPLRVMIEQWVIRNIPQPMEAADKNLEAYVATLPEGFRSTIPTLRDQYGKLSTDIHSATCSSELFETSQADVIRHFEARRLWEL
jgi:hypothetical protein